MKEREPEVLLDPEYITPILTLAALRNPDDPEKAVSEALEREEDRVRKLIKERFLKFSRNFEEE